LFNLNFSFKIIMFRLKKNNQKQGFVDPSPWPLLGAFAALMSIFGGVLYMHGYLGGEAVYSLGFFMMFFFVFWMLSRLSCVRLLLGKISLGFIFFLVINKNFLASCEGEKLSNNFYSSEESILAAYIVIVVLVLVCVMVYYFRNQLKETVERVRGGLKKPFIGRILILLGIGIIFRYNPFKEDSPLIFNIMSLLLTVVVLMAPSSYYEGLEKRLLRSTMFQEYLFASLVLESVFCTGEYLWLFSFYGLNLAFFFIIPQAGTLVWFYGLILYLWPLFYYRIRTSLITVEKLKPEFLDRVVNEVEGKDILTIIEPITGPLKQRSKFLGTSFLLTAPPQIKDLPPKGSRGVFGAAAAALGRGAARVASYISSAEGQKVVKTAGSIVGSAAVGSTVYYQTAVAREHNKRYLDRIEKERESLQQMRESCVNPEEIKIIDSWVNKLDQTESKLSWRDYPATSLFGSPTVTPDIGTVSREAAYFRAEKARIAAEQARIAAEQARQDQMAQTIFNAQTEETKIYNSSLYSQWTGYKRAYPEKPAKSIESVIRGKQDLIEHKTKMLGVLNEVRGPDATSAQRESFWEMVKGILENIL
jgi:hypothetical protein